MKKWIASKRRFFFEVLVILVVFSFLGSSVEVSVDHSDSNTLLSGGSGIHASVNDQGNYQVTAVNFSQDTSGIAPPQNVTLTQSPIFPISYEPVTIETTNFVSEPLLLNVTAYVNVTYIGVLSVPKPFSLHFILNMTFNPVSDVKTITIPGLPSLNRTIHGIFINHSLYINSSVEYQAISSNLLPLSPLYKYSVSSGNFTPSRPMLFAFPVSDLNLSNITSISNYYGLSTPGMVAYPNENIDTYLAIFSDKNITAPHIQYSISGGVYKNITTSNTSINSKLFGILTSMNDMIANLSSWISTYTTLNIRNSVDPFHLFKAIIPAASLGNYVSYRGIVESGNHTYHSLSGMYYITNESGPKLFLIDPHPFLWILSSNFNRLFDSSALYNYSFSTAKILQNLFSLSLSFNTTNMAQFEHLEKLGETNDIYVGYPSTQIPSEINNSSPSVLILDGLSLGYESIGLLNWDLATIPYNNTTVQNFIINYVEMHHTGVIATAGTLSDLRYWQSPSQQTAIGSFGMIGSNITDANPINPQTIASLLGFSLLPLYELLKNVTAQAAYNTYQPAGEAIGSAPLLTPDVPWNGSLDILNNSLINGLNNSINVNFSNPYSDYGWNATSSIGWQLEFPSLIETALFKDLKIISQSKEITGEVSSFLSLLTSKDSMASSVGNYTNLSMGNTLRQIYNELTSARTNITNISINTPFGVISIPTPREILSEIPLKIVAVSPNYESGVITYNKYFSTQGYRSAYISFNPFLSNSNSLNVMMNDLVEWTNHWKYEPITPFHGIIAAGKYVENFVNLSSIGTNVTTFKGITTNNGSYNVSLNLQVGHYSLIYLSPYANLSITIGGMTYSTHNGSGSLNFTTSRTAEYNISVRADSDFSMNQVYFALRSTSNYDVTFTESGLPSGTTWYVNLSNGIDSGAVTGTSYSFSLINGTYPYTIATSDKTYEPSPSSGSFPVNGATVSESITFSSVKYPVTFTESGLPSTATWYANITGEASSGQITSSSYSISLINGTYYYAISTSDKTFEVSSTSASFTVNGSSLPVSVKFSEVKYTVTFTESGLPSGTTWYVNLSNGIDSGAVTGTSYSVSLTNGTYSYTVSSVTGYTASSSGSITVSGNNILKVVTYTATSPSKTPSSGTPNIEIYGIIGAVATIAAIGLAVALIRKRK